MTQDYPALVLNALKAIEVLLKIESIKSRTKLAQLLGTSRQNIYKWIKGVTIPRNANMIKIMEELAEFYIEYDILVGDIEVKLAGLGKKLI